eukprot:gene37493-50603_t
MLAGMGGVSYAELAAAVSNAGGYGVLGMAGTQPDFIREQMRKVRTLTDKPFGVDLLAASPESLTAAVEIIIEEGASSFIAGLGLPMPIMEKLKKAGLKVMVVCGAVKHAVKAEQAGCDAVICQSGERLMPRLRHPAPPSCGARSDAPADRSSSPPRVRARGVSRC